MIRNARPEDIPALLDLGAKALAESEHPARFDRSKTRKMLRYAIMMHRKDGPMRVWVAETQGEVVGVLIGQMDALFFSSDRYATDLVFYTHPSHRGHGLNLVRRFLEWARNDKKVVDITLQISSGIEVERTQDLYERLGLKFVGGCFVDYKKRRV